MPHSRASRRMTASLALPPSGAARTATRSATPPSASARNPSTASCRAPGWATTRIRMPSAAMRNGKDSIEDVFKQQIADEPEQQDDDQRREIHAADQRHDPPDRPQHGIRHLMQE